MVPTCCRCLGDPRLVLAGIYPSSDIKAFLSLASPNFLSHPLNEALTVPSASHLNLSLSQDPSKPVPHARSQALCSFLFGY